MTKAKTANAKDQRCWPGYEPVKGKPQHRQGSCRLKAESKLSESEQTFRRRRKKQLAGWKKRHPGSPTKAAQHLHAPGTPKSTAGRSKSRRKRS